MIEVTKLNDEKVTVNADLIEMIEEVPETVITFTNGIKNILVENSCLWSAEQSVYVEQDDAASRVSENTEGTEMKAITLDTYCEKNRISKVDYIKMDIEGAEYEALLGTENVIRKNKPKLAICVYHSAEDFIRIPQKIKEYVPEYRLYLSHKNEDLNETVVFATV